jgi:hypothetical protein
MYLLESFNSSPFTPKKTNLVVKTIFTSPYFHATMECLWEVEGIESVEKIHLFGYV